MTPEDEEFERISREIRRNAAEDRGDFMNLVPKEILMSHLQRSEGAEEVSLPIDFFRDLLYQAMPRTWVGLTEEEQLDIFSESIAKQRSEFENYKAIENALRNKNA